MAQIQSAQLARYETVRTLAFGAISGAYAAVGTRWENPCRILKVVNATDADLSVSFNGVDNQDVVLSRSAYVYDFGSDRNDLAGNLEQPPTFLYVKDHGSAATSGSVYVVVIYASAS